MQSYRRTLPGAVLLLFAAVLHAAAKDKPELVVIWPSESQPVVRFNFGKFQEISSFSGQRNYRVDVQAENLWNKPINHAAFAAYMFDKNHARIGEAYIDLSDVPAGQSVKFTMNFSALGKPSSMELVPKQLPPGLEAYAPPKSVSLTVYSVPSGALVTIDGTPAGTTPTTITLATGKHQLRFSKEGFNPGMYPVQISGEEGSGGSITYELGSSAHDTVELRDGTVISGDLESVSATQVVVVVGGKIQTFDRNQIKRILLVQREPAPSP
jgi:hypothetical protein